MRSRMRKRAYVDELEERLDAAFEENKKLSQENAALKAEKQILQS